MLEERFRGQISAQTIESVLGGGGALKHQDLPLVLETQNVIRSYISEQDVVGWVQRVKGT